MAIAILSDVKGSKSLPREMGDHLAKELAGLIAWKFTDSDGKRWSQTRIGEVFGVSQSQISDMERGDKWGATSLVALSRETGKSIDELLGPTAPAYRRAHRDGVVTGKILELFERIDSSGFGYSGKNEHIPRLIREIRTLLRATSEAEFHEELRASTATASAIAASKRQASSLPRRKKAANV